MLSLYASDRSIQDKIDTCTRGKCPRTIIITTSQVPPRMLHSIVGAIIAEELRCHQATAAFVWLLLGGESKELQYRKLE